MMKAVVLDNYREVVQTISYEEGLVVIDRKKPPLPKRVFLAFVILLCLGMIAVFFYVEALLLSGIWAEKMSVFRDWPVFLLVFVLLAAIIPAFFGCLVCQNAMFGFHVVIRRENGRILYHLKNGVVDFRKTIPPHHFAVIKKQYSRGDWNCRAYIGGGRIDSVLSIPLLPLVDTLCRTSPRRKSVVIETVLRSCLRLEVKNRCTDSCRGWKSARPRVY